MASLPSMPSVRGLWAESCGSPTYGRFMEVAKWVGRPCLVIWKWVRNPARKMLTPWSTLRRSAVRGNLIAHLQTLIDGSDAWTARKHNELVGFLKTKPGLRRYLRRNKSGLLRIDRASPKREAHLDGKWLLRTSTSR